MANIRVIPGEQIADPDWDAFVRSHPLGSCFHTRAWTRVVTRSLGHRLHCLAAVEEATGRLAGVLPLAETKSALFGHAFSSLPGAVESGILAESEKAASMLAASASEKASRAGASHLELRHRQPLTTDWKRNDELYFSFRRELADTDEAILLSIPRKQRAEVRKGIAAGCRVEIDLSSDRFFTLYADNVHRHGTPGFSKKHFDIIKEEFGDQCEFFIVTDDRGEALSGVLSLYFGETIFPYYAGDIVRARSVSANDFKYYSLMTHARKRGIRVFDYGRSKRDTGPYNFKKYWGFEPVPYRYEFALFKRDSIPQNNPLNPKYATAISIWRSLPRAVVSRVGHPLARHLC
jgi:FemAB-related protein (PEP-CTERM system-associated)